MRIIKFLTASLIILTLIILVDMGHSALPLGFMELFLIPYVFASKVWTPPLGHETVFPIFILIGLAGHIILFLSFKKKYLSKRVMLTIIGQIMLLFTIIFLIRFSNNGEFDDFTFYWSLPGLINMAVLTSYLYFGKRYWHKTDFTDKDNSYFT